MPENRVRYNWIVWLIVLILVGYMLLRLGMAIGWIDSSSKLVLFLKSIKII